MQPVADLVGRVGPPSSLIADHQHSAGCHPDDPGQPQQLPDGAHGLRLYAINPLLAMFALVGGLSVSNG